MHAGCRFTPDGECMKPVYRALLVIELVICFGPVSLLLAAGILSGAMQLTFATGESVSSFRYALFVFTIAAGLVGLIALFHVFTQLLDARGSIRQPIAVLMAVIVASAVLLQPA